MTASKAIIEKEYQPHVIVSTAGPNPFTALTDRELEEYRREVERKQRGPGGGCARPAGPAWCGEQAPAGQTSLGRVRAGCHSARAPSPLVQASSKAH